MKNRRALIYAIVAAGLAFFLQCAYIKSYEDKLAGEYEPLPVLMATRSIPSGVPLDDSMVELQTIPKKFVQPKAVSNIDALFGQISSVPILEGEQIIQTKLLSIEEAGLARKVPPGHRAVALAVDEISGVGGHLRPGNHVDIIGTFDFGDASKHDVKAIVLLQNVEVLSVGSHLAQAVPFVEEEGGRDKKKETDLNRFAAGPGAYKSVTVGLTPTQVPKVVLAQEVGALSLSLLKSAFLNDRGDVVRIRPMGVDEALGLPKKVYRKPRPTYREIRAGGY